MGKVNVFLAVAIAVLGLASAVTDDEKSAFRAALLPILSKCTEEFGTNKEDVLAAKKAGEVESLDSCLAACFFKGIGAINEAGLFVPDVALEKNKKYFKGEDDQKTIAAIVKTCTAVNQQTVSDGEKGCERSKLLLSCLIKENGIVFFPFSA